MARGETWLLGKWAAARRISCLWFYAEQEIPCLPGIGSVSHHVVSGPSSQVLNGTVAELFIPFLQQEGNYSMGRKQSGLELILVFTFTAAMNAFSRQTSPKALLLPPPCAPTCFGVLLLAVGRGPKTLN